MGVTGNERNTGASSPAMDKTGLMMMVTLICGAMHYC